MQLGVIDISKNGTSNHYSDHEWHEGERAGEKERGRKSRREEENEWKVSGGGRVYFFVRTISMFKRNLNKTSFLSRVRIFQ